MINMFSQMACICHFLCPAQSLLWVYLVWVHSQCSLEVLLLLFQLFRCRHLALNRCFPTFLGAGMFHTWGVSVCPHMFGCPLHICTAPICLDAPMPPYVQTPLYVPNALCASVCSRGYVHMIGGCRGPPYVWTPPCVWMPPHVSNTPMHLYASLHSACSAQSLLWVYPVWFIPSVVCRFSKYYFQFLRCRNLALNRCSSGYLHMIVGYKGPSLCLDTPMCPTPLCLCLLPCMSML